MLYLGPIIVGFILGFILGTRINMDVKDSITLPLSSLVVIFIALLIFAWQLGAFPFYDDVPISTGVASAVIGLFAGNILFKKILKKN
jgi:energy-converting hydrogenase B subunit J